MLKHLRWLQSKILPKVWFLRALDVLLRIRYLCLLWLFTGLKMSSCVYASRKVYLEGGQVTSRTYLKWERPNIKERKGWTLGACTCLRHFLSRAWCWARSVRFHPLSSSHMFEVRMAKWFLTWPLSILSLEAVNQCAKRTLSFIFTLPIICMTAEDSS